MGLGDDAAISPCVILETHNWVGRCNVHSFTIFGNPGAKSSHFPARNLRALQVDVKSNNDLIGIFVFYSHSKFGAYRISCSHAPGKRNLCE